jgi:Ca2+-transporting ATPase
MCRSSALSGNLSPDGRIEGSPTEVALMRAACRLTEEQRARITATRLGLCPPGDCPVADSAQVEALSNGALADLALSTRVFARILPGHKLKVVSAYRQGGRVVAMVGDGVNDGPALKAADIGITMGRQGAQAARDLSDIVLENDDLAGLGGAVARGRAIPRCR